MALPQIDRNPYRSTYIPLPTQEVMQTGQALQQRYDGNRAMFDQLNHAVSNMNLLDDQFDGGATKERLLNKLNEASDMIADNDNAWEHSGDLMRSAVKQTIASEDILNKQKSFEQYRQALNQANEYNVSPFQRYKLQKALNQYQQDVEQGKPSILRFNDNFYEEPDIQKKMFDRASKWIESADVYVKKDGSTGVRFWAQDKWIDGEEVLGQLQLSLISDPETMKVVNDITDYSMREYYNDPQGYARMFNENINNQRLQIERANLSEQAKKQMLDDLDRNQILFENAPQQAARQITMQGVLNNMTMPAAQSVAHRQTNYRAKFEANDGANNGGFEFAAPEYVLQPDMTIDQSMKPSDILTQSKKVDEKIIDLTTQLESGNAVAGSPAAKQAESELRKLRDAKRITDQWTDEIYRIAEQSGHSREEFEIIPIARASGSGQYSDNAKTGEVSRYSVNNGKKLNELVNLKDTNLINVFARMRGNKGDIEDMNDRILDRIQGANFEAFGLDGAMIDPTEIANHDMLLTDETVDGNPVFVLNKGKGKQQLVYLSDPSGQLRNMYRGTLAEYMLNDEKSIQDRVAFGGLYGKMYQKPGIENPVSSYFGEYDRSNVPKNQTITIGPSNDPYFFFRAEESKDGQIEYKVSLPDTVRSRQMAEVANIPPLKSGLGNMQDVINWYGFLQLLHDSIEVSN